MKTLQQLLQAGAIGAAVTLGGIRCANADAQVRADTTHTIQAQFAASPALDSVLVRACGDCHSNSLSPDWSSRAAPVRWIMNRAAKDGRKALNFAEWAAYSPEQQRSFLIASCADAKTGKMPVGSYLRFRPEAKLATRDVETICTASTAPVASAQR